MNANDSRKFCGCNTIFDIDAGLNALQINLNTYKINSNKRLDEIVGILCLKCGADSRSNDDVYSNRSSFHFTVLKIKGSQINKNNKNQDTQQSSKKKVVSSTVSNNSNLENRYFSASDHTICNNCIDDYSRELIKNNIDQNNKNPIERKDSKLNNSEVNITSIYCNICESDHIIDGKVWNNIIKKKACCQGSCEIF